MNKIIKLLFSSFFFGLCYCNQFVCAQQIEIPGVTDITTIPAPESSNPVKSVQWLIKNWQDATYFVHQITNQSGTVTYRDDLKAYVISSANPMVVYPPNTMVCSQWTGIVYNWSEGRKWNNKPIQFDGRYFQARDVMPIYGGEQMFYLHLTHVQ